MFLSAIIAEIDAEIRKLQQARDLIEQVPASVPAIARRGPGRPRKNALPVPATIKTRTMSAEGRARVAAAQKKRWAAMKKAAK